MAAETQIESTITSPPTHHDSDAASVTARLPQLRRRKTLHQHDSIRVGISLLRASNNCSPYPPSAINASASTSEQCLWIGSPSRRHEMMLRGIQLWGRRHQETPHLSDQLGKNTAISHHRSLGLGVSVKAQQTSLPASNGHICKVRFRALYKSANKPAMSCCGIRAWTA